MIHEACAATKPATQTSQSRSPPAPGHRTPRQIANFWENFTFLFDTASRLENQIYRVDPPPPAQHHPKYGTFTGGHTR